MRKATDIMIRVTDSRSGVVIGHITCDQFRTFMNDTRSFIPALVKRFNDGKVACNEPERAEQVVV